MLILLIMPRLIERKKWSSKKLKALRINQVRVRSQKWWGDRFSSKFKKAVKELGLDCEVNPISENSGDFKIFLKHEGRPFFSAGIAADKETDKVSLRIVEVQGMEGLHRDLTRRLAGEFKKKHGKTASEAMVQTIIRAAYDAGFDRALLQNYMKSFYYMAPSIRGEISSKISKEQLRKEIVRRRAVMRDMYKRVREAGQFDKVGTYNNKQGRVVELLNPNKGLVINEKYVKAVLEATGLELEIKADIIMPAIEGRAPITKIAIRKALAKAGKKIPDEKLDELVDLLRALREPSYFIRNFP
ncbi:MAG: hypothetical protein ABID38_05925 [Candidatus Diapherotrites archaeon]